VILRKFPSKSFIVVFDFRQEHWRQRSER